MLILPCRILDDFSAILFSQCDFLAFGYVGCQSVCKREMCLTCMCEISFNIVIETDLMMQLCLVLQTSSSDRSKYL